MTRSMARETKLALASAIFAAWCVSMATICQAADNDAAAAAASGTATPDTFACSEDLLPCQEFVHDTETETMPSQSCCEPLDRAMATDKRCVCAIIENEGLLQSLNITKEDIHKLTSKCEIKADEDYCKEYSNSTITRTPMVNPIEAVTVSSPNHGSSASKTAPTILSVFGMFFLRELWI